MEHTEHHEHHESTEFNQTDSQIVRDRGSRFAITVICPITVLLMGYSLGGVFATFFKLPTILGNTTGAIAGVIVASWMISRSFIINDAVSAFVTVNPLATGNKLRSYGPGTHFCYWWEQRASGNNVDLSEAAENFKIKVQSTTGGLMVAYSVRLRPDIEKLPEFLSGVASVAADIGDLISAKIMSELGTKPQEEALTKLSTLNEELRKTFYEGASGFEKRFGVKLGDVTVHSILPTEEVQKALDGAAESAALDKIVARTLGYPLIDDVHAAVAAGKITSEEVATATENAMVITDNLHGMDLKRQTFILRIQGQKDLVDAAKAIAESPAGAALASTLTGGKTQSSQQSSNKRRRK